MTSFFPPVPKGGLHVVGAAVLRGDLCLVAQRPAGGSFGFKWEFPGGKVEQDESPEAALVRELKEELGVQVRVEAPVGRSQFETKDKLIVLDVYFAELARGEPEPLEHVALRWVSADELFELDWAAADVPLLPPVHQELQRRRRPI